MSTVLGVVVGVTSLVLARRDIAQQRSINATFGEAHCADTTAVVVVSIGLSVLVLLAHARHSPSMLELLFLAGGVFFTLRASLVDIDTHTIPQRIVVCGTIFAVVCLLLALFVNDDRLHLGGAVVGGIGAWLFMRLIELLSRGDMGHADVTLSGYLGLLIGALNVELLPMAFFAAFLLAGLVAVVMMISRTMSRSSFLPFGPFLVMGMLLTVLR